MYVSVSRLRVEPGRADDLVAAFRNRAHQVDGFDGFIRLEVWQVTSGNGEMLMVSHWRDHASFTAYMKSASHRESHGRVPKDLARAVRLLRLEHLTGYEVVAQ